MILNIAMGLGFLGLFIIIVKLPEFIAELALDNKWVMPAFYIACGIIVFMIGASMPK